jgi:hypothetical protein
MWVELLKKYDFTELPKIVEKTFSIPISNAFVKRGLMKEIVYKWKW